MSESLFIIKSMVLRNADNGTVLWESQDNLADPGVEHQAHVPASILKCKAVSREVTFYSSDSHNNLRLVQRVYLGDQAIEDWRFHFGFVIPDSTNSWQSTIHADKKTLPADVLSGNVVIETCFYDGKTPVSVSRVRLFYD